MANNSPQIQQLAEMQETLDNSPRMLAQRKQMDGIGGSGTVQRQENNTGLPDALKAGVEILSGLSMDDVKVHYNSPSPAQLQALAYTQGTEVHVGPGQERHLPHEAWHVVQQKQGRVSPTMQLQGKPVNTTAALEHEADVMGMEASRMTSFKRSGYVSEGIEVMPSGAAGRSVAGVPIVQGLFDWAINAMHNTRKVGVEITEDNTGANRMSELAPIFPWPTAAPPWAATVNLSDNTGAAHIWHVNRSVTLAPYYQPVGGKNAWMKWGDVSLTEDHGDYEWIVKHPAQPQGVTYYRDRLAEVAGARTALRTALGGLNLGRSLVLSDAASGTGMTALFNIPASTAASSQITFESVNPDITRRALMEGITHGLVRSQMPNRTDFLPADNDVFNTVTAAAARSVVPNVDMGLIMAYVVGDLTHKIATLQSGPLWTNAAANFKDWRVLFPKSHPYQVLVQSLATPPTLAAIAAIRGALNLDRANILTDVRTLFAQKLLGLTAANRWHPAYFGANDPGGHITNAITGIAPPAVGPPLETLLDNFLNANVPNFLTTEFANVVNALTDPTGTTHVDVVRSSGFAHHPGSSRGVAFEDRGEVADHFPGLAATYARIQHLVDRY